MGNLCSLGYNQLILSTMLSSLASSLHPLIQPSPKCSVALLQNSNSLIKSWCHTSGKRPLYDRPLKIKWLSPSFSRLDFGTSLARMKVLWIQLEFYGVLKHPTQVLPLKETVSFVAHHNVSTIEKTDLQNWMWFYNTAGIIFQCSVGEKIANDSLQISVS